MPEIKLPSSFRKLPTTKQNVKVPKRNSLIPTRAESDAEYDRQKNRSTWQSTKAFIGAIPEMIDYFEETWGGALNDESIVKGLLPEVLGGKGDPDAYKALMAMPEVGTRDLARIGKMIVERFNEDDDLPEETKKANHHRRQVEMINYMTDAREKLIEAKAGGKYMGDMRAGADIADITNIAGGSGVLVKGYTGGVRGVIKGGAKTVAPILEYGAKGLGTVHRGLKVPEKIAGSTAGKVSSFIGVSAFVDGGSSIWLAPVALEIGKIATKYGEKIGRNSADIARVFARPSSHERFLYRLATDPNVSEKVRKLATTSHKLLGTKMYDVAFDAMVGGTSAGILQSALQYASGATDEQAGMAFGTGLGMGGGIGGAIGQRGSGKDSNALDVRGNLTARSQQGIREYIAKKNSVIHTEAITELAKASPSSAVLLSTMDALAPVEKMRMQIVDLNEFAGALGLDPKDAPSAHYDRDMGLMILNKNDMQGAVAEASHIFAHEFGHHFMQQHLGKDITTRRQVLESYEDPEGKEFFFLDKDGNKIKGMESVRLNGEAMSFAQNYADRVRKTSPEQADRILKDAGMLAEEMGADMFATYFGQNPNVFDMFEPQFRSLLLGGARDALAKFGIINPKTGAENAILPFAKIPKPLKNLYKNYLSEAMEVQQARADAVDTGQKVFPKQGDTAQSSFKKTNGGLTWDLLAGNDFILKDQQMFDEFSDIMEKVTKDLDKKYVGLGRDASNQNMHPLIRDYLKNNSLRPDVMDAIVDMVDTLIASRERVRIGKRSGHQGQWSDYNPYYIHDITLFGYQFSPKAPRKNKNRKTGEEKISYPSMKVMAYNNEIVESNIQAMAQAGLLKKYNNDPQKFADALTAHAQNAFKKYGREDPINPQGKGENELFAIAFGSTTLKADVLKDPINKQFWAKEGNGMKNAIKSYQIGELVGANTTGTKGFAVDYNNMKNNFMPSRSVGMNHAKQRKINWSGTTSFMPSLKNIESGEFSGRLKPYPMYRPNEGNMRMESHLRSQDIWKPDGTLDFQKSLHLGLNNDIATAIENGVMSVDKQLKPIDYDSKLRRNYRQDDPRRSGGNRLKDGYEHDGSPLSIRGEKGRVEEGGGFVDFVHFPTRPVRRKVLKTDFHGTGIKGAEGSRKANYPELYSNRTYFGDGNYKPEKGLITDFAHHTKIDKNNLWTGKPHYNTKEFLYDFEAFVAEQGIQEAGNGKTGNTIGAGRQTAFETFLKKQGFLGMYAPNDHVGFMFHDIEVGTKSKPTSISYPPAFVPEGRSFMPSKGKEGSGLKDGDNNLIAFPKKSSDPVPLSRVRTTFYQINALDRLHDKGLISYENGKNDTVIAKVISDEYPMPEWLIINKDGSIEQGKPNIKFMPSKGKLTPEQLAEKQAKEAEQIKKDTLSYAIDSLTPEQKQVLKENPNKSIEEALGGEWSKAYGDAKYHVELTHKIKKLEGNKKAVESQLTIKDYGDNEIDGSVALPARMGIINANKKGMFSSYKDVTDLIKSIVTKIEYTKEKYPDFAQRTALFYSDMGNTAYQMAQVIKFPERTLFDVADLQLRFLALGSPRSAVSANMTKSARSMMHPHGSRAGHKINPADQQIAGNRTAKEWDRGEHFEVLDPDAIGADDKVRNFYLNGLAELIEIAKVEGTQRDVDILLDRASKTLGLTKKGQNLSPKDAIKLQQLLDGLATVDMWDMAGKGYAHPAYIPISKRAKQQMKSPFHWSVEKHRKVHKAHGKYWNEAMKQMRYQHTKEIKHQQANALQIDGRKDWNEDNWAVRQNEPIDATTEWSYYTKADEDGLTPKGGGALYDAHQTVDGLIADELNKAGYAKFFGKKKLYARNAQEILWALTKLDNPLPANQNLVLFGDRFTPLYEATMKLSELGQQIQSVKDLPNSQQVIDMLMTQADKTFGGELPTSATQIMSAVTDSYNKTATQILPFEVTTFGASKEALAVQAQEKLMGQQAITEKFSQGLGEQLQQIADGHGLRMRVDEVKVGQGGYTENGVTAVAPNITMALKGDPSVVNQVMVEISRGLDQADGNVFRRPTVKEVNMGGLNEAVTFDTTQLDATQKKNFFTDLSTLVDGDGDSFLTGFTESTEGMFIADLYYKPERLSNEIINNETAIRQIMGKHNVPTYKTEQLVADNYTRSDSMPVKPERPTARTAFARDVFNLTKAKINNLQNRKYDGLPQVADSVQRIYNQAEKVSSKHYNTSKLRENAMAEVQELVDIAGLEGFLDKDDAVLMKEEVKTIFKSNEKKNYFTKGTVEKKAFKRLTDRVKSKDKKKATKAQKKNILWAYRPQDKANEGRSSYFSEKQFQTLGKNILGEGKSTDLIGGNLRKSAKTNYLFDSSSKSGRIKK
jgi:hypothetical protein